MGETKTWVRRALCAVAWAGLMAGHAPGADNDWSRNGADDCVVCHGPGMPQDATALLATPHGAAMDPQSPMGQRQCESCHGPSRAHVDAMASGREGLPPVTFGPRSTASADERNRVCLDCHETTDHATWAFSEHAGAGVACSDCHVIHQATDPMFDPLAQQQTCFDCHGERRADREKPSAHPLRFGAMGCSSCHDPHRGDGEAALVEDDINTTCLTCHAEKRGPFLWEHAPASEDCSLCHQAHGSLHPPMLVARPPQLCQSCHAALGHPSLALEADDIDDAFSNRFLMSRGCLNCHSQVHGSNHPSGATLQR